MYAHVVREGTVAVVTMDGPGRANAFRVEDVRELDDAVHAALADADVAAIVIAGAGGAFCAGADVKAMAATPAPARGQLFRDLTKHHHEIVRSLRTSAKPVVAAIDGAVAGGGFGLALAADVRIGSPRAFFRPGYLTLGVPPDGGLTFLLPRAVGTAQAQRIVFEDAKVAAEEALALGLLHRVAEDARKEAVAEAARLAKWPRDAFAATKGLLNASYDNPLTVQLAEERMAIVKAAGSEALARGLERFQK